MITIDKTKDYFIRIMPENAHRIYEIIRNIKYEYTGESIYWESFSYPVFIKEQGIDKAGCIYYIHENKYDGWDRLRVDPSVYTGRDYIELTVEGIMGNPKEISEEAPEETLLEIKEKTDRDSIIALLVNSGYTVQGTNVLKVWKNK